MSGVTTRGSGSQYAYAELRRQILTLELAPGSRLFEESVAASLGVSRTPLREALRQLASEGLLERQPTGGLAVPSLDLKEIVELYDVRASLEAMMTRAAAVQATPEDIEDLRGLVARNEALVAFPDEAMRFGKAMHSALADIAGNSWALRLHTQISAQMERYRRFTNNSETRRHAALAQHRQIVEGVAAADADAAGALAHQHVIDARDEAVRAIGADLS